MTKASKESTAIAKHINTFLSEYAPSQKTRSEHTLKSYEYALSLYISFLETEKEVVPEQLSRNNFDRLFIEEWLMWLADRRNCSPETCNNRLASLRVFLKYLGERDISMLYLSHAASGIPRRKGFRKKVKGMSKDAVKALMSAPDISSTTGRRDLALIVLIYSTAARLDEVLSMKVGQLHLEAKKPYVSVIGKGNKVRTLYLLPKAVAHISRHIKEGHGDTPDKNAYVFYSRNSGIYGKLSQTAVSKRLKIHAATARQFCKSVPLDIHAHQLRHAKASHWLEDGMNIVQISFLLGHEQVETTMVYLDVTTEQELQALATLEEETDCNLPKKWKTTDKTLANFCGTRKISV